MNVGVLAIELFFIALLVAGVAAWRLFTRKTPVDRLAKRAQASASSTLDGGTASLRRDEERGSPRDQRPAVLRTLDRRLGEAGMNVSAERFALYMAGATLAIGVVFPVVGGVAGLIHSPAAFLVLVLFALAIGVGAPMAWISRMAARRIAKFEAQFPSGLDIFVRGLRAGHPVSSALELLVSEMPDPMAHEFGVVTAEMNYGADLRAALANLARRVDTPDVNMFVVSVAIQSETGGNLADILEGLARVIRERASMVLKVRALSSEGRMTAVLLSILPVATFSFIFATRPHFYLDVASDPVFLPGVLGILMLYLGGIFTMNRLVQIKV